MTSIENIKEYIGLRVEVMREQHVPEAGPFDSHAYGNIFGSLILRVDSGNLSAEQLREAVEVYNDLVPDGRRVQVYKNINGELRTRFVERVSE